MQSQANNWPSLEKNKQERLKKYSQVTLYRPSILYLGIYMSMNIYIFNNSEKEVMNLKKREEGLEGGKGREKWCNYFNLKAKFKSSLLEAVGEWVALNEAGKNIELTLQPSAFMGIFCFTALQPCLCISILTLYFLASGRTRQTSWWEWGSKLYSTKALSTHKDPRIAKSETPE